MTNAAYDALEAAGTLVEQIATRLGKTTEKDYDGRPVLYLRDGSNVTQVHTTYTIANDGRRLPAVEVYQYVDYGEHGRSFGDLKRYRTVAPAVRFIERNH